MKRWRIAWASGALDYLRCGDDLDRLERLQDSHGPNDRSNDTSVRAAHHAICWGWLGEDASIARSSSFVTRCSRGVVQHHQLAFRPQRRRGDQRFPAKYGSVRDQVSRRRVIGAVEDNVIVFEDCRGFFGGEVSTVRDILGMRVQAVQSSKNS